MKAALYIRVSTEKQVNEGSSLEVQEDKLRKYCEFQGWEIQQLYADKGISGTNMDRPQFQDLMQAARQKQFDVVIVLKLDRFGRSLRDLINSIYELNGIGIQFISINDNINTTTPNGKLLFHILGAFSEFECAIIKERMLSGIARAKEEGRQIGRVPMGYKVINGDVVIDPEKEELVRHIFYSYAAGETAWKISKRLNMKPSTISYILKNPFYADPETNGEHEPLITEELFDAIQPTLKQHRLPYQPMKPIVKDTVLGAALAM